MDKEVLHILELLLLKGEMEGDCTISTPYDNNIMHSTFHPKSTFYPHHSKNEFIKTFYAMVYADFKNCVSNHTGSYICVTSQ